MDGIRQTAVSVCAVLIICSALEMLLPGEKYKKAVSVVLGAVFLATVLTGITEISFSGLSYDVFSGKNNRLSDNIGSYAMEAAGTASEKLLGASLSENGIEYENILVGTNISADGSISIERVEVSVAKADASSAEKIAKGLFGESVTVVIKEK